MFYGHLVHVGESLTDLQILGCELHIMRLAAGLRLEPLGEPKHSPDYIAVIMGRGGSEGEGKGWKY